MRSVRRQARHGDDESDGSNFSEGDEAFNFDNPIVNDTVVGGVDSDSMVVQGDFRP